MSDLADTIRRTARAIPDGYTEFTVAAVLRPRAKHCVHLVLPSSLNWPERNNLEHGEWFKGAKGHFTGGEGLKFTIDKVIVDVEQRMAVVRTRSHAETVLGPYDNEYVWTLYMSDDGTEVVRIEEFIDSGYTTEFFGKLQAHLASQQKSAE